MPKIETHKATAKRCMITSTGKLLRWKRRRSRLRGKKSKRVLRSLDTGVPVTEVHARGVRQSLGLGRAKRT